MAVIFEYSDYKQFIKDIIRLHEAERGFQSRLATAAGCQRSYLSQVLNRKAHLMPDHVWGLATMLGLSVLERDQFMDLLTYAKAVSQQLKASMLSQLEARRQKQFNLEQRLNANAVDQNVLNSSYYATWIPSAVHVLLSVPRYQTPDAIAVRLKLDVSQVVGALSTLEGANLAFHDRGRWHQSKQSIHLPRDAVMTSSNHCNWRMKAMLDIQSSVHEGVHYTGIHSLSLSDETKIRGMIVEFLRQTRECIAPSPEEEVVCFNLDFFKL